MSVYVDVQRALDAGPEDTEISHWVEAVINEEQQQVDTELTVRIVDEEESAALNQQYRNKSGATNVLSFPFDCPAEVELNLLGDLVICAPVVEREALQQGKAEQQHWAHMVVHGTLHLLGYDHIDESDALVMEAREKNILCNMGYPDPYQDNQEQ